MKKTLTLLPLASLALLSLCACDTLGIGSLKPSMTEETVVSQRPIEIVENRHIETLPAREITYNRLIALSEDYANNGDSPLYVVFGYDPNKSGAKLAAFNRSNIVRGQLGKLEVHNAVVKTTPIVGSNGDAVIAYDRLTARGPQNCGTMPGNEGTETGSYGDYGLGCTVNDMIAKQIASPADLEGREGLGEKYDGGRAAAQVNRDVRAGEVNDFVPSYILSELAANTSN